MNASACVLIMSRSMIAEKIYVILCLPSWVSLKWHNIERNVRSNLSFSSSGLKVLRPFFSWFIVIWVMNYRAKAIELKKGSDCEWFRRVRTSLSRTYWIFLILLRSSTHLRINIRTTQLVLNNHNNYPEHPHHEGIVADALSLLKESFSSTESVADIWFLFAAFIIWDTFINAAT